MACGADGCGVVTGELNLPDDWDDWEDPDDWAERADWDEDRWWSWLPVDPELVELAALPAAWETCVALAMPREAPRAPTMPSPANPAWSRLLRWRGVMSSTLCGVPVPNL